MASVCRIASRIVSDIDACTKKLLKLEKEATSLIDKIEEEGNAEEKRELEAMKDKLEEIKGEKENKKEIKPQKIRKCRYWNRGYCREGRKCFWSHPEGDCQEYLQEGRCRDRGCPRRHRKVCRYSVGEDCTRKRGCQYLHQDVGITIKEHRKDENKSFDLGKGCFGYNISDAYADANSDEEFDFVRVKKVPREADLKEFKCDQCQYKCKKEITMRKHMNTKHGAVTPETEDTKIITEKEDSFDYTQLELENSDNEETADATSA
jgi:hypothetical protein